MIDVNYLIHMLQADIDTMRGCLQKAMGDLATSLTRAAKRLDDPSATHPVNALGEVQQRGMDIDRMCALYPRMLAERTRLERMLAERARLEMLRNTLKREGW